MTKTEQARGGVWGGEQMNLIVRDNGASIEFNCAKGVIDEAMSLDRAGRFDVSGTYSREGPGPVRKDNNNNHPARFTGGAGYSRRSATRYRAN